MIEKSRTKKICILTGEAIFVIFIVRVLCTRAQLVWYHFFGQGTDSNF